MTATNIVNAFLIRHLYEKGHRLMQRYTVIADEIAGGDFAQAEQMLPRLKRYRRRAKGCVRLIQRLRR